MTDPLPLLEPPAPPPIPPGRRAARLLALAWPFLAWCGALGAAVWLYFGETGHGHALAIEEIEELKVALTVEGRIATVSVEIGQKVREGDVLATLDTRDVDGRLRAARADLDRARARLAAWQKDAAGPAPDARILPFEQDLRAQDIRVAELEAERAKLQVVSPAAGAVSALGVRAGEWRAAGTDLVHLVAPRPNQLTGYVTDRQISAVQVGTMATLRPRDLAGAPLLAKVTRLGPQIEPLPPRLRAIPNVPQWGRRVIFQVDRPGEPLPGQIYEVRFH